MNGAVSRWGGCLRGPCRSSTKQLGQAGRRRQQAQRGTTSPGVSGPAPGCPRPRRPRQHAPAELLVLHDHLPRLGADLLQDRGHGDRHGSSSVPRGHRVARVRPAGRGRRRHGDRRGVQTGQRLQVDGASEWGPSRRRLRPRSARPRGHSPSADDGRYGGQSTSLGEFSGERDPGRPGFALPRRVRRVESQSTGEGVAGAPSTPTDGRVSSRRRRRSSLRPCAPRHTAVGPDGQRALRRSRDPRGRRREPEVGVGSERGRRGQRRGEGRGPAGGPGSLWVRGAEHMCEAGVGARAGRASTARRRSARANRGRRRASNGRDPSSGWSTPRLRGVMFTCNPVSGATRARSGIDASWGPRPGRRSEDEVTPDEYRVGKVTARASSG